MATTKQQKMIDSMFCRMDKKERLLVVAQEVQALSKEIQLQIQKTYWKATKNNANNFRYWKHI
jgi:transposase